MARVSILDAGGPVSVAKMGRDVPQIRDSAKSDRFHGKVGHRFFRKSLEAEANEA